MDKHIVRDEIKRRKAKDRDEDLSRELRWMWEISSHLATP
jgi:hypothetical protein